MLLNSDPSYRGTVLFAVQVAFLVIAWILVLLRAYVKIFMMSKISADDWWMLATMVSTYPALNITVASICLLTPPTAWLHGICYHRLVGGSSRRNW